MIKQNLLGRTALRLASTLALAALVVSAVPAAALAQSKSSGSDDIENLFSKDEQVQPEPQAAPSTTESKPSAPQQEKPNVEVKGVSDLAKLEAFEDVAVIQRRFLPKTGRFEVFVGPTVILNDAFFLNYGVNGRFGYSFSERYGVEFVGTYLSINERQVTSDLREKRGVLTKSFVTPQSYAGLDFKWSPVYGKMTWNNKKITPFDMYFSAGVGLTGTNQNTSEATLHLGTGQTFAHTKGIAWRWDFSWDMFTATSNVDPNNKTASLYHNLFLTLGASFFFPEASYR